MMRATFNEAAVPQRSKAAAAANVSDAAMTCNGTADDSDSGGAGVVSVDGTNDLLGELILEQDDGIGQTVKARAVVNRVKLLMLIVLVASATAVATTVFVQLRQEEHDAFVAAFDDEASRMAEAIGTRIATTIGLLETIAISLASYAQYSNQIWPFVTMRDFATHAAHVASDAAVHVSLLPVVSPENHKAWEDYSALNDEWLHQATTAPSEYVAGGTVVSNESHNAFERNDQDLSTNSSHGTALVLWQNYPVVPNTTGMYSLDYLATSRAGAYSTCIDHRNSTISTSYMAEDETGPISDLSYPILDGRLGHDSSPVGILVASVSWRAILGIRKIGETSIIRIVLDNPCSVAQSYEVEADLVQYLGPAGHHDAKYDNNLQRAHTLHELVSSSLNTEYCPFTVRVYATSQMESYYKTSKPAAYAVASLLIFASIFLLFLEHVRTMESYQKTLLLPNLPSLAVPSPCRRDDCNQPIVAQQPPKLKPEKFDSQRTTIEQPDESKLHSEAPFAGPDRQRSFSSLHDKSLKRFVDWNGNLFARLLKEVVQARSTATNTAARLDDAVSAAVTRQLEEYIASMAALYQSNAFHSLEHCSHVVRSTKKLLDRIAERGDNNDNENDAQHGILSDPLTRFAIIFSALIRGVANSRLAREPHDVAMSYEGRSMAEQAAMDQAWQLLMEQRFASLRTSLLATSSDVEHFRQIVENVVIATDLFDRDLRTTRESRWNQSFSSSVLSSADDELERRMTFVLDLIIQASDVSHTMQRFAVYKKWNMCLLAEMHDAYQSGRTTQDPLEGWFDRELCFFDDYVIPLAERLRDCDVFGASCDELLQWAIDNRKEWELNGRDIVRQAAALLESSTKMEMC